MDNDGPVQALVSNVLDPLKIKNESDQRTSDVVEALNREVLQPLQYKDQEQPSGSKYRESFLNRLDEIAAAKTAEEERLRILDERKQELAAEKIDVDPFLEPIGTAPEDGDKGSGLPPPPNGDKGSAFLQPPPPPNGNQEPPKADLDLEHGLVGALAVDAGLKSEQDNLGVNMEPNAVDKNIELGLIAALAANAYETQNEEDQSAVEAANRPWSNPLSGFNAPSIPKISFPKQLGFKVPSAFGKETSVPIGPEDISLSLNGESIDENIELGLIAALVANAYESQNEPDESAVEAANRPWSNPLSGFNASSIPSISFPKQLGFKVPSMPFGKKTTSDAGPIDTEDTSLSLNDQSIDENIELGLIAALAANAYESQNGQGTEPGDGAAQGNLSPGPPTTSLGIGPLVSNSQATQIHSAGAGEVLSIDSSLTPRQAQIKALQAALDRTNGQIGAIKDNFERITELQTREMGLIAALAVNANESQNEPLSPVNDGVSGSSIGPSIGPSVSPSVSSSVGPSVSAGWGLGGLGWRSREKGGVTGKSAGTSAGSSLGMGFDLGSEPEGESDTGHVDIDKDIEMGLVAALGVDTFLNSEKDGAGAGAGGGSGTGQGGWFGSGTGQGGLFGSGTGQGGWGFGSGSGQGGSDNGSIVDYNGIKGWLTDAFNMEGFDMGGSELPYPIDYPTDGLTVVTRDGAPTKLKLLQNDPSKQVDITGDDSDKQGVVAENVSESADESEES